MKHSLLILASALLVLGCQKEVYHNITVYVNPAEGGSVSPSSGPVLDGTSVSFKATPNGDYVFTGWSGSVNGTENPKTVTVTQDMNVTANFILRSYPLTITIEGDGTVAEKVVSTKSEHQSGTVVELTANPSDHWLFDHWEGDITGATNPAHITVSSAKNVKAVFVEKTYPLNIEIEGEGAVSEKIIQTKATYQEGNVVELTANPSTGWSFDHWGGDLSGNDNPVQITVSSEMTVKAIFTKNEYSYNLKIVGPGVVDEYLIETKSSLEYGSKIMLKAFPSEGAVFKGWSSDQKGLEETLIFDLSSDINLTATFETTVRTYPIRDLMLPSVKQRSLYYGTNFYYAGMGMDYNSDGFADLVYCPLSDDGITAKPIRFYTGTSKGTLIPDNKNDNKITGQIWPRKQITGDYNGDGILDICLIGHGWDYEPFPGEYPIILFSNPDGTYSDIRYENYVSFYHGGTSADFDNDGDLDIFLIDAGRGNAIFLINDGEGNFSITRNLVNQELMDQMYTTEMIDLDKDGYVDLLVGLGDNAKSHYDSNNILRYDNTPIVFWGNGETFNNNSYTRLPETNLYGMGTAVDFYFYDIDSDGYDEMFLSRTGDGQMDKNIGNYQGWDIQVIKCVGREFKDITSSVFVGESYVKSGSWIGWIDFEEVDGEIYLMGRFDRNAEKLYKLDAGKLYPVNHASPEPMKIDNGIALYTDGGKASPESYLDLACDENPYAGNACIKFYGWKPWDAVWISLNSALENGMDLTKLFNDGYALEFYIRNTDPSLNIDIKIESFIDRESWKLATFFYQYNGVSHNIDGTWERIVVPLNQFEDWSDKSQNYWDKMDHIHFQTSSGSGEDFYIDEIRIRKIIQ